MKYLLKLLETKTMNAKTQIQRKKTMYTLFINRIRIIFLINFCLFTSLDLYSQDSIRGAERKAVVFVGDKIVVHNIKLFINAEITFTYKNNDRKLKTRQQEQIKKYQSHQIIAHNNLSFKKKPSRNSSFILNEYKKISGCLSSGCTEIKITYYEVSLFSIVRNSTLVSDNQNTEHILSEYFITRGYAVRPPPYYV